MSLNGRRMGLDGDKRGYTGVESDVMAGSIHESQTVPPPESRGEGLYTPLSNYVISPKGIRKERTKCLK